MIARALGVAALVAVPSFGVAQAPAPHLYVVKQVGDWVVFEQGGPRALGPLVLVAPGARIGLRSTTRIDTTFVLVLRDPRSLRVATWSCNPVASCLNPRPVSQLTFADAAVRPSSRTGALFVNLGDATGARPDVRLVGARGAGQDWGLMVLAADSGWVDAGPLVSRLGGDRQGVVLRICPMTSATGSRDRACMDARDVRTEDCALDAAARCRVAHTTQPAAVSVQLFVRRGATLPNPPIASAFGVITTPARRQASAALAEEFWRELVTIRDLVEADEFRALIAAAALEIARARP